MAEVCLIRRGRPTAAQRAYLKRGLDQPGGKLPLFDEQGQRYPTRTIRSCIDQGWAETWFDNPIKPDWLVCRLTDLGFAVLGQSEDGTPAVEPYSRQRITLPAR